MTDPEESMLKPGERVGPYEVVEPLGAGAMGAGSADRYGQAKVNDSRKFVPEGVEGLVPYRGSLAEYTYQFVGGLRAAMGYCGCATIDEMRENAHFVRVTGASLVESHPHDIQITREAPNYSTLTSDGE